MDQTFFNISNSNNTPVINITGEIGWNVNYNSLRMAVMDIVTKGEKKMKLVINSVGGSMVDGFAMYDFVKSLNLLVEVEIIGMAASMAGVFAMCASPGMLGIHSNALIMTHRPQSGSYGESDNHRTAADLSDKLEAKAKAVYVNRGIDPKKMADWFKPGQMKWFTAEEALAAGIVDFIISDEKKPKDSKPMNSFKDESSAYKYYNSILNINNTTTMNKILVSVVMMLNANGITNVTVNSSEDEVVNALNSFSAKQVALITDLNNKIANAAKERAKDLVANYKALGKIPANIKPEDEQKLVEQASTNPDMFVSMMEYVPGTTAKAPDANNGTIDFNKDLANATKNAGASANPEDKTKWTIRDWEEKDPAGLKNMLQNNQAAYHKLFVEFYNSEPFPLAK